MLGGAKLKEFATVKTKQSRMDCRFRDSVKTNIFGYQKKKDLINALLVVILKSNYFLSKLAATVSAEVFSAQRTHWLRHKE